MRSCKRWEGNTADQQPLKIYWQSKINTKRKIMPLDLHLPEFAACRAHAMSAFGLSGLARQPFKLEDR
jgi:hypothetical protein